MAMRKGKWRRAQIVDGLDDDVGYTLWVRADTPSTFLTSDAPAYALRAVTNIVCVLEQPLHLAYVRLEHVRLLDEYTDTPPLWDSDRWAQWSEKLPLPTTRKRRRAAERTGRRTSGQ